MTPLSRADNSLIGRWWWTVDLWSFIALMIIIFLGVFLNMAASPAVADRIGVDSYYFIKHQLIILIPTLIILFSVSLSPLKRLRQIALVMLFFAVMALALTLVIGTEIKGARRWISLLGFSLQPSEFVKPAFAVISALLITSNPSQKFLGYFWSGSVYVIILALLLSQPDIGMAAIMTAIWFSQLFLAGLPLIFVAILILSAVIGIVSAYFIFPHAAQRINQFLDPAQAGYQVEKSLEAFKNGGFFGRGPGEGRVKEFLPDAHADFIFAVAGEEFGFILCLFIIMLFVFILWNSFKRLLREKDLFVIMATTGLLTQFGLQAIINMASTLHLIPTKGMTLPFISFGGSSLLALGIGVGMIFALTRKRPDPEALLLPPPPEIPVSKHRFEEDLDYGL
jgi:cell division protein FtsW